MGNVSAVEFALLGSVAATAAGKPIRLGRRRERLLLGVLLLEAGRGVSTERLTDLLWDDDVQADHRSHLHTAVARLRAILAPHAVALVSTAGGYLIDVDPQWVDAHRFAADVAAARDISDPARRMAALGRALAIWRGEPLADVANDRIRGRVGRSLRELHLDAVEWRAEAALAAGNAADAAVELADAQARYPTRERLVLLWMTALVSLGRPSEALAAYREVYHRLDAELGMQPGPELQDLHIRILRGGDGHTPAVPADATSVSALPRDLPGFIGRHAELRRLSDEMAAGGPAPIMVISGPGGSGKTTLATHWSHRASEMFPDGRVHVNLRGFGGTPARSTADAVTRLLIALGVSAGAIPSDCDAALAAYQERLAGRRILVVLDNAGTADQVRPLIPAGVGCGVLVTSRRRLDGLIVREGARSIAMQPMSQEESLNVLRDVLHDRRLHDEHDSVLELIELCRALPLAIRIAAANLAARPDLRVAAYCARLRASRLDALSIPGDDDTTLRMTLRHTYHMLAGPDRRALRLLALHQGEDIGIDAAASLLGTSQVYARQLIEPLIDSHLVEQPDDGRYGLHDLVREFAAECLADEEPAADADIARQRMLGYYLASTDRAMSVFLPALGGKLPRDPMPPDVMPTSFDDVSSAMGWLDRESANLTAETIEASSAGPHRTAVYLADALLGYFLTHRHANRLLAVTEAGVAAATAEGDQILLARALRCLGSAHLHGTGDYAAAEQALRRAVLISRALGDVEGTAHTLINLCSVSRESGRLHEALTYAVDGHNAAEAAGALLPQANALFQLAALKLDLADWPAALGYAGRAADKFIDAEASYGVEHAMLIESEALMEMGDLAGALARTEHTLARSQQAGLDMIQLLALSQLAVLADREGRYREGVARADEAIGLADTSGNPAALAHCRIYRGDLYLHLDELATARVDYRAAVQIAEAAKQPHATVLGHIGLARVAAASNDHDTARRHAAIAQGAAARTELVGLQMKAAELREQLLTT